MDISEIMEEAWNTAEEKGWHEKPRTFLELAALIHSEVSESVEAWRESPANHFYFEPDSRGNQKPEGVTVELADVIIRICETAEGLGLDLNRALREKLNYNKTRPYRHGGKYA